MRRSSISDTVATAATLPPKVRCAAYTRKSTEENLNTDFNSLDAQREACESYVQGRRHDGWVMLPTDYSDGGYTGANTDRPALQRLLEDVKAGKVDVILTYKIDRLSRSLLDFAKLMEVFEQRGVSFVSVTQHFDSSTPMGRLTVNVLMSFSQYEREIIGERIRDKVAAAKRRGKFTGGMPPLGYDVDSENRRLVVNPEEAKTVRHIFKRFTETGSPLTVARELNTKGITTKSWMTKRGVFRQGNPWHRAHIHRILNNRTYLGEVIHRDQTYPGEHEAIVSERIWCSAHRMIEENVETRARHARAKEPALLRGIVRCGVCDAAMSPVSAQSRGKHYRYYTCTKASKNGADTCPVKSVPAGEVEGAVMTQLRRVFGAPETVARTHRAVCERRSQSEIILPKVSEEDVRRALQDVECVWEELYPAEQMRIVRLLVDRVMVMDGEVSVTIRADGLHSLLSEMRSRGGIVQTVGGVEI